MLFKFHLLCLIFLFNIPVKSEINTDSSQTNFFQNSFTSINHSFQFDINANISYNSQYGKIELLQRYKGNAISIFNNSFRDDEKFTLKYEIPFYDDFFFLYQNNYLNISESAQTKSNELKRLNLLTGIKYIEVDKFLISLLFGYEDNKTLEEKRNATLIDFNAKIDSYNLEDYIINSELYLNSQNIANERKNNDFKLNTNFTRVFDEQNNMYLSTDYFNQNRALLVFTQEQDKSIKTRYIEQVNALFTSDFHLYETLVSNIAFNFSYSQISNSFNKVNASNKLTNVLQKLDVLTLNFNYKLAFELIGIKNQINLIIENKSELNSILNKYELEESEFNRLVNTENQRDYSSNFTFLTYKAFVNIAQSDTLEFNFQNSIFQYDTPSSLNDDDRDELNLKVNLRYIKNHNSFFSYILNLETNQNHYVYLKSSRSASNFRIRNILFSSLFTFKHKKIEYSPGFEISANYTIYDYEMNTKSIKSFSHRSIQYKDSLKVHLNSEIYLYSRVLAKYFEEGSLFWKDFSESPKISKIDLFGKLLLYWNNGFDKKIAFGFRYYLMRQENISNTNPIANVNNNYINSISPELEFNLYYDDMSLITVSGWYEFQFLKNGTQNQIPNIMMNFHYNL